MKPSLQSSDEASRPELLERYSLPDARPEQAFDDLTALAVGLSKAPISLISLTGEHGQWLKSTIGLSANNAPHAISFCAHAVLHPGLFVVTDAALDERFADNPWYRRSAYSAFSPARRSSRKMVRRLARWASWTVCLDRSSPSQQEALMVLAGR